jgi:hypothetical protein
MVSKHLQWVIKEIHCRKQLLISQFLQSLVRQLLLLVDSHIVHGDEHLILRELSPFVTQLVAVPIQISIKHLSVEAHQFKKYLYLI